MPARRYPTYRWFTTTYTKLMSNRWSCGIRHTTYVERCTNPWQKETSTMANVKQSPTTSNLSDILTQILDKGIVIDLWARLSLLGTEILSLEARVVVASVETYLSYAEAIGLTRLVAAPAAAAIAAPAADIAVSELEIIVPAA